jgi:hypothetical protein
LKPNTLAQFISTFKKEVLPVLYKQQGFKDVITFATPGSSSVLALSLWDTQKNAEMYNSKTYNDVLKMLTNVLESAPKLENTEVLHSTFHEIRTAKPIAA